MVQNHLWFLFSILLIILIYKTNAHFYPIKPPHLSIPFPKHHFHKDSDIYLKDYFNAISHHGFPEIEIEPSFPPLSELNSVPFHPSPHPEALFPPSRYNFPRHEPEIVNADVRHKDVVLASLHEQALPSQYRNPFYKNERIRSALAANSWFHHGETPVFERNANKIPRSSIFKLLWNAGFLNKQH